MIMPLLFVDIIEKRKYFNKVIKFHFNSVFVLIKASFPLIASTRRVHAFKYCECRMKFLAASLRVGFCDDGEEPQDC